MRTKIKDAHAKTANANVIVVNDENVPAKEIVNVVVIAINKKVNNQSSANN